MENIGRAMAAPNKNDRSRHSVLKKSKNFSSFDRATFMFLRPSDAFTLWNSTSAMRRNGYQPSIVAAYFTERFGIEVYDPSRSGQPPIPNEALALFERLIIPAGVQAPSLIHDDVWGRA